MVGRDDARRQLEGAAAARMGEPALVLVSGEAGIAKTRLVGVTTDLGDQGAWPQRAGGPFPRAQPERYGAGGCSVSEFGDNPLSMESIPTSATRALGV